LLDKIKFGLYGKTGGYLLVARQYRQVITATDKERVMTLLPAAASTQQIERFFGGDEGSAVLLDARGVELLASVKQIPAANWFVLVGLPTAEAFAPIRSMQQHVLHATLLMTLLAGVLTWWMLRRLLAPMLAAVQTLASMSSTARPVQLLPVTCHDEIGQLIGAFNRMLSALALREDALAHSEHKLSEILENVDAHIYVKDTAGRYLFANRPVRALFGVSMAELVGQTDAAFLDPASAAQVRLHDRAVLRDGATLKTEDTRRGLQRGWNATYLSTKLPLRNEAGQIYALCGISTDISERKLAEESLRIAAIAFECQDGIVVMDAGLAILRVNQAFTRITGYSQAQAQERPVALLPSPQHARAAYRMLRRALAEHGAWRGQLWLRHAHGEHYLARGAIAAVTDETKRVTHYVGNFNDATGKQQDEQQRLQNETDHRNALVREVHHRIKNNLQGITGILRQFAHKYPETREPINQAIIQVRSISVIHGLQGRTLATSVRLCELTGAIAGEIAQLWQTAVQIDMPDDACGWVIAESEAVPVALVLNELILNAVKHGGKADGAVRIALRNGAQEGGVSITIWNVGQLGDTVQRAPQRHSGLQLIAALMPRHGARIVRQQRGAQVETLLELYAPVVQAQQCAQLKA
jgi:PAS domain S-box-containing protein